MLIRVTGDERDVANSAWVSTLNEVKAQAKTQEEVERVVKFLVDNFHTSPFESVTLTFEMESYQDRELLSRYQENRFARTDGKKLTIDLLNFIKETSENDLWNSAPWLLFKESRPILAKLVSEFKKIQDTSIGDVDEQLGDHGMTVELVHLHDEEDDNHSRATWRIKCPLSIAVQILRHRSGSFNMTSGRYRTITQKLYAVPDDVLEISKKSDVNIQELFSDVEQNVISKYLEQMKQLKRAKNENKISNDEYKRARECIRFVLPEGRMTELYATFYLSDFYSNYKKLRDSSHAQIEHIWIAREMDRTIKARRS